MSSIITGILNSTIGLLWNKARDSTAAKLQQGDVTDAKIREIVVRELDIKTKHNGLSRKDLLSSYNFLKQGVDLLNVCLDQSWQSVEENRYESSAMSSGVVSAILPHYVIKSSSFLYIFYLVRKLWEEPFSHEK